MTRADRGSLLRPSSAVLVARAIARSWLHRPVRLVAAVAGGIGGVMLTTAVLMIAVPILQLTDLPPVKGLEPGVIAVTARAAAGMSGELTNRVVEQSGATTQSRLVLENTTAQTTPGHFAPVVVLGVDAGLLSMLDSSGLHLASGASLLGQGGAYLERHWAADHGLARGDAIAVDTPTGVMRWTVSGILDADVANHGAAVVVLAPTAAAAFNRGSATDVLLLRGGPGPATLRARAAAAVDGAADVSTPDHIFAGYGRMFRTPVLLVSMFAAIAVLTGGVVLFLTWRLALADARPILSRMRLVGIRSVDLMLGTALVLIPVLLLTYVIGAGVGLVVGESLSSFRSLITNLTGQAFDPAVNPVLPLLGAFIGAIAMFGFAWLSGLWQLRRISAIDAITGRDLTTIERSRVRWPVTAGLLCFAAASAVLVLCSGVARIVALIPLIGGLGLLATVVPVLAGTAIRHASPGAFGLFVGRQLEVEWRRNAALGITFAVALVTSITMFGVAGSVRHAIDLSMARSTGAPLIVEAAPASEGMEGETFPATVPDEIDALPGVSGTDTFCYTDVVVNGGRYMFESLGGQAAKQTKLRVVAGAAAVVSGQLNVVHVLSGDSIAVSENFARTQHVGVGSRLDIPTPDGHRVTRIVAVVDDSVSDGGMLLVGQDLYRQVAGDSRVFSIGVALKPGVDRDTMQHTLQNLLSARYPRAEVITVAQYRDGVGSVMGRLMSSFSIFAWVMYGVAAIVGAATLVSSIGERGRAIALTRLIGGGRQSVRNLLGAEALVTVFVAWIVAVPAALVAIPAMIGGQSLMSGLAPPSRVPLAMVGLSLPLTALAIVAAIFVARRSLSERPLAELLADE